MSEFVHLHLHTEYSLLDGVIKIDKLLDKVVEYSMPAVAITDHGALFGAIEFYRKAIDRGIKPIIGAELYIAERSRKEKLAIKDVDPYKHILLIARNDKGYRNLIKLSSIGYLEGFYYKPRIDREVLERYSEGLMFFTGCLKAEIPSLIIEGKIEKAEELLKSYIDIFGRDNVIVELMDLNLEENYVVNQKLLEWAKKYELLYVATNDVHYLEREDYEFHEAILALQTGKTLQDPSRFMFKTKDTYFRSSEEMEELFSYEPEAIKNTRKVADRIELTLKLDHGLLMPNIEIPSDFDSDFEYLKFLAEKGLRERFGEHIPIKYKERLKKELEIIGKLNFSGYFLVIYDIVNFARSQGIPVGPGRGSAVGSLVLYALSVTQVDPMKYSLLFERFLNPERISPPDVDIDFGDKRRDEVIEYIRRKYGEENVSQIITFGRMKAKQAIRDMGRVLGYDYSFVDRLAREVIFNELEENYKENPIFRKMVDEDEGYRKIYEYALKAEGLTRHASVHAAGIVVAPSKITDYVPLYKDSKGPVCTQFEMNTLESIGLLKIDILGLKTLTVIDDTIRMVKDRRGKEIDLENLPLDDKKTYELLSRGNTYGVFQLESRGMRELLKRLSPNNFEDIIAILSLYRPGPIQAGATEEYVRRKKGKSPVLYPHPSMEGILKETYGLIVYQEQVMRMAAELAGFSMAKADMLRKAMGKKKEELMSSDLMGDFIKGMVEKGIPEEIARDIAQKIHSFAQYAFNKSHSTGYALLSYITAYLKAHFREEFYTAILNSEIDKIEKLSFFLQQARREGIEILPPCIINSEPFFKVEKDGKIRYGLLGIKNVGKQAVLNIVDIRSNKRFSSFEDFLRRVDSRKVNKKVIEALIKAGAFDVFGKSRAELFSMLERRSGVRMQGMLFGELNKEKSSEFSQREEDIKKIMKWEKEVLNTYLTKHPLEPFELYVKILSSHTSKDIQELSSERERGEVRMCGILSKIERRIFEGENKKSYFILHLEDFEGEFQGILFEEVFKKVERFLEKDEVYYLEGELSPSSTRIICNDIMPLKHAINLKIKKVVLNINVDELTEKRVEKLKELLAENSGTIELWFRIKINSKKKLYKSNDFKISLSEGLVKKIEEIFGENKMEVLL